MTKTPLTYAQSGVDVEKAKDLVTDIQTIAAGTKRSGVVAGIGGFGALFEIPSYFKQPLLVSSTDGVGTKLKLAIELNKHDTIGIDLVAMCVNDVICQGAEPLFFLDYFATGKLNTTQAKSILEGIAKGCQLSGAALIGGETAEMPGMYAEKDYDLAGFCVGAVEKSAVIDGSQVKIGDQLIALASSGPHSNGYSLIRRIIDNSKASLDDLIDGDSLGNQLLTPTRIYVKSILSLLKQVDVHAIAHITGGGLIENIPRVLPKHTQAVLATSTWEWPPIFQWLQKAGGIETKEMSLSFNLGIGLVISVSELDVQKTLDHLKSAGETAWVVGHIASSKQSEPRVSFI